MNAMAPFYAVFKEYNYNDENLRKREQTFVNAAKNIIRNFEATEELHKTRVELLEIQVKNLKEYIKDKQTPVVNPMEFSDQDFNCREKFLIQMSSAYQSEVESLRKKLEKVEAENVSIKSGIDESEKETDFWKSEAKALTVKLAPIQNELRFLKRDNKMLSTQILELEKEAENQFNSRSEADKFHYHEEVAEKLFQRTNRIIDELNEQLKGSYKNYSTMNTQLEQAEKIKNQQELRIVDLEKQVDYNQNGIMILIGLCFVLIAPWILYILF